MCLLRMRWVLCNSGLLGDGMRRCSYGGRDRDCLGGGRKRLRMVMSVGWVVCVRNCPCSKGLLWGTAVYEGCFWKGHRLMDPGLIDEGYHCRTRIHLIADVPF